MRIKTEIENESGNGRTGDGIYMNTVPHINPATPAELIAVI